jgi:hypothetical protein
MTTPELTSIQATKVVDARAMSCPGPLAGSQEEHRHRQSRRSARDLVGRRQHQERHAALVREGRARVSGRAARRWLRATLHPPRTKPLIRQDEKTSMAAINWI